MPAVPIAHQLEPKELVGAAIQTVKNTLHAAGTGGFGVADCRTTDRQHGWCYFGMKFKARSGRTYICHGKVLVRDIGNGAESAYKEHSVYCNNVLVN